MYSVDAGEVPRAEQENIHQYDQALESTAAITHKNYVVHFEDASGNYVRILPRSARHVAPSANRKDSVIATRAILGRHQALPAVKAHNSQNNISHHVSLTGN